MFFFFSSYAFTIVVHVKPVLTHTICTHTQMKRCVALKCAVNACAKNNVLLLEKPHDNHPHHLHHVLESIFT